MLKTYQLILLSGLLGLSLGCASPATPSPLPTPSNTPGGAPTALAVTPTAAPSVTATATAIATATAPTVPATPPPASTPAAVPTATLGGAAIPRDAERTVAAAKADLARRASTAAGNITVVSITPEEWRDSALGCPEPGKFYAQVITPGYRVVLTAAGKHYEYHTDTGTNVVLCQPG